MSAAISEGRLKLIGGTSNAQYSSFIEGTPIASYFETIAMSGHYAPAGENVADNDASEGYRGDNVSPDLREMMAKDPSGKTRVEVILQAKDANNEALRSLLASGTARIADRIGDSDTLVVNLPLTTLQTLSTSGLINYVSPNRPTRMSGHVEDTIGATLMRAQPANGSRPAYTLDGSGVGVAVLDSGIYASQRAFLDGTAGRLAFSKSFVPNVTSTDDDYGHGTHVASLAAGSSSAIRMRTGASLTTPRSST